MTSSNPDCPLLSGPPRRRARAEAPRGQTVRVRLSPEEARAVADAAERAGVSVGAWVGEVAVRCARTEGGSDSQSGPGSWRELVAALVRLRTEVHRSGAAWVVQLGPAHDATELLEPPNSDEADDGHVGLMRRIDAATAAASAAASRSGSTRRRPGGRRGPVGSAS